MAESQLEAIDKSYYESCCRYEQTNAKGIYERNKNVHT